MGAIEILEVLAGGLLRLMVPVGFTLIFAAILKRLDDRWRVENLRENMLAAGITVPVQQLHCFEAHGCPPERRSQCRAGQNPDEACWDAFSVNGQVQSACKRCAFRKLKLAAIPS